MSEIFFIYVSCSDAIIIIFLQTMQMKLFRGQSKNSTNPTADEACLYPITFNIETNPFEFES